MRRFFTERSCELRYYFIIVYLLASALIGAYAYKAYKTFFAEKKFMMEIAAYKISLDFVNIFDHAETTLNGINKKILEAKSDAALATVLIQEGKNYDQNVVKYELSTGKFYWIDAQNRLIANSEVGLLDDVIDLSNRDYLRQANKDPRHVYLGDPIIGAASGQYVIPVGVGAQDQKGKHAGTMALSFKVAEMSARYKEIADLYGVNFALLGMNNDIIFESKENAFAHDKKLFDELSVQENNLSDEFISSFDLKDRVNSYVALRTSDKYQYKVLVGFQNKFLK